MGFKCLHCGGWVSSAEYIGTKHRNHCPFCLWSKHVDLKKAGDRKSGCQAEMEPIGLTFKQEGQDKYGKPQQGELMIIHQCTNSDCGKISINRIAGDDNPQRILEVFRQSLNLQEKLRNELGKNGIKLLTEKDKDEIYTQIFGKK